MATEMQAEQSTAKQNEWLEKAVDRLWERFENRYGALWMSRWQGLPLARVKAEWAGELRGFRPEAIALGFDAAKADEFPPSLPKFIEYCRSAAKRVGNSVPALAAPAPLDRESAARRASEIGVTAGKSDPHAAGPWWAHALRKKYLSGERLLPVQINLASEALGEVWSMGKVEITERLAA